MAQLQHYGQYAAMLLWLVAAMRLFIASLVYDMMQKWYRCGMRLRRAAVYHSDIQYIDIAFVTYAGPNIVPKSYYVFYWRNYIEHEIPFGIEEIVIFCYCEHSYYYMILF